MIVNGAAIRRAATGFHAMFLAGFEAAKPIGGELFYDVDSEGNAQEEYHYSGGTPSLREWHGPRHVHALSRFDFTIKNKEWEATIGVPTPVIRRDKLGLVAQEFRALGARARLHRDELLVTLLANGHTELCYDAAEFFDGSHPTMDDSVTWSNLVSGALSGTTFDTAMLRLRNAKDYSGKPAKVLSFGGRPTLIVPPTLQATAEGIVEVQYDSGGATNRRYKKADILVLDELEDESTTVWYLGIVGGLLRPFVFQTEEEPVVVAQDQPTDDAVFMENEVRMGVSASHNAGYGHPQFIVRGSP